MPKHNLLTKKQLIMVTIFFLVWRTALFGLSAVADHFLKYSPTFPYADSILVWSKLPRWAYSWANFDGVHYVLIAENGYIGTGLVQAFFPLLPYVLLHTLHSFFGDAFNPVVSGLVITNLFAYFLALIWFIFVQEIWGQRPAWIALASLFLFPSALFFGGLYTESLFLFLVISAFFAAKRKWWLVAGVATLLASASRVVGIFLIPALLIELILQNLSQQSADYYVKHFHALIKESLRILTQNKQAVFWICFGSLGLLSYMFFLNSEFHDPLYFAHVQAAFGGGRQEKMVVYPQVVWRSIKILITSRPFDLRYFTSVQEFLAGVVGFLALLWSLKYVRFSYVVFGLLAFILPTTTGNFSSMSRYLLACFPIFLLITKLIEGKRWRTIAWFGLSSIILIINVIMFIQGYWVA